MTYASGTPTLSGSALGIGDYDFTNIQASGGSVTAQLTYDPNQWINNGLSTGTTGSWSASTNWSKGAAAVPDNGLTATFGTLGSGVVDLGSTNRTLGALVFNNPAPTTRSRLPARAKSS